MTEAAGAASVAAPLGILACAGPLPIEVAEAGQRLGRRIHIVAIEGFASEDVARFPHERVSLGEVGRILASFRRAGVAEIVIAGAMQRPNLLKLKIDWGFLTNLPTVLALTKGGDDSVLRRIVRFFEGHGLRVLGLGELAPDLLAPSGLIAGAPPASADLLVIKEGVQLVHALGPFDIGQGVVVGRGGVIAIEGVRGTDAMLRDLGPGGAGEGLGAGAVLVKLPKPGQEMRIDLPTVGAETVRKAKDAGLGGIAVGAGATIVLERARLIAEAQSAGLFVLGVDALDVAGRGDGSKSDNSAPSMLRVAARRAPTPADRADIVIGRRLMPVLRAEGAGRAAIVSREHVLAVSGSLPLPAFVAAQGRPPSWGRRALRKKLGTLLVDSADGPSVLDADLFRAVLAGGLAGVVWLGVLPEGEEGDAIRAWANEARVFLMDEGTQS